MIVMAGIATSRVPRRGATVSATWIAKAGADYWALNASTPLVAAGVDSAVVVFAVGSGDNRPPA